MFYGGAYYTPVNGTTTTYSLDGETYSPGKPTFKDVTYGPQTVYFKIAADGYYDYYGQTTVNITPKPVTVSGITANDKVYDKKEAATLDLSHVTLDGVVGGENLVITATGVDQVTVTSAETAYGTVLAPETSSAPVYRLYNSYAGEHHYTMDAAERDELVTLGWTDDDIGWYSDDAQAVPLYREYNPNEPANNHNYTASLEEHDGLVALGWHDEGVAWYGVQDLSTQALSAAQSLL